MTHPVTIHLGAGAATEWSADTPEGLLVLVEPNPALQPDLKALAREREAAGRQTRIFGCAVSDQDGPATFHVLSFSDLSGLHDPEPLRRMLPGLRIDETITVQVRAVTSLIGELQLAETGNRLIIEAMGEEGALLDALDAAGLIATFDDISVQTPVDRIYPRGLGVDRLTARMEAQDCRAVPDEAPGDPDWPRLRFRPDHALRALRQLVAARDQSIAALTAELETARAAARKAAADLASESETHQNARNELVATRERQQARITVLENNLNEARATAKRQATALDEANARIAELDAHLEAMETAQAQLEADLDAALTEAENASAMLDEARRKFQDERTELTASRDLLHERVGVLEGSLSTTRTDLAKRRAELETLTGQISAKDAEIASLSKACETLREEQKTGRQALAETRERTGARISLLESSLNEARASARKAEAELESARARLTELNAERAVAAGAAATAAPLLAAPSFQVPDGPDEEDEAGRAARPAKPGAGPASAPALAGLQSELARLKAENGKLATNLARSQQDASLALRLQSLAQGDLKELQARYAALLSRKEEQDRLLSQLVTRLGDAAAYLQQSGLTASAKAGKRGSISAQRPAELPDLRKQGGRKSRKKAKPGRDEGSGG